MWTSARCRPIHAGARGHYQLKNPAQKRAGVSNRPQGKSSRNQGARWYEPSSPEVMSKPIEQVKVATEF